MQGIFIVKVIILIIFLPLMACSNGNNLSRSEAAKQIKEALGKNKITHTITLGNADGKKMYSYSHINYYNEAHKKHKLGKKFVEDPNRFIQLSEKGLVNYKVLKLKRDDGYKRSKGDRSRFYEDWFEISLTAKGKKYATEKMEKSVWGNKVSKMAVVRLAELDSVEITGLTEPSDAGGTIVTKVEYVSKYKLTPFGEVFKGKVKLTRKGYVYFQLYDDGWRHGKLKSSDFLF